MGSSGNTPEADDAAPSRRRAIIACLGAFAALALPRDGQAQAYPDRTINYIVPSSPGSSPDIVGRIMAEALAKILGQPVVVMNRAGAGGTIAAAAAAKATRTDIQSFRPTPTTRSARRFTKISATI
jgi:tripartite-type tricarboxylate transporter receptor subunit TctC